MVNFLKTRAAALLASTTMLFSAGMGLKSQTSATPPEKIRIPVFSFVEETYHPRDFRHYDTITYNKSDIQDNGINPLLMVVEPSADGKVSPHHQHTSRAAWGVSRRLGAEELSGKINVLTVPYSKDEEAFRNTLEANPWPYRIVSYSMAYAYSRMGRDKLTTFYQGQLPYSNTEIHLDDQLNYVFYNSAGNNGEEVPQLTVEGKTFFVQSDTVEFQHTQTVRVGAVSKLDNGTNLVDEYSSMNPTFCAALPAYSRFFQRGTSFSGPAAAAVERHLVDIFGRSQKLPEGVVHEDVLMALMLTADTSPSLVRHSDGAFASVFTTAAGLPMTADCGAGVIQPQKAADLLQKMVLDTRANKGVTPSRTIKSSVTFGDTYSFAEGNFMYEITVPESGTLISLRAGIPFKLQGKGAATLKIAGSNHTPVVLDLSPSGLTTEFRFSGYRFKAGDKVIITTTRPLLSLEDSRPFVDFTLVAPGSPVEKAVEARVAEWSQLKQAPTPITPATPLPSPR